MSVSPTSAPNKFGGNVEECSVCHEKVYPMDRFVIEKLVMHKNCFKCKHCDRKLSLSNFAAVNNTVYCKVHYLKLFKESGGKYDKAFGDGGFQKKTAGFIPGQFKGVSKGVSALPSHMSAGSSGPQMSPVVASVKNKKPLEVSKLSADDDEDDVFEEETADLEPLEPLPTSVMDEAKPSVKDMLKVYEASLRDASSASDTESPVSSPVMQGNRSPPLTGSAENRRKWLTGISSQHVKTHAQVDETPGGSIAERRAAYLAQVSGEASSPPHEPSSAAAAAMTASASTLATQSVSGNLANRQHWGENLGQTHIHTHTEIDRSSMGTAAERKQAYLEKASGSNSPSSPSPSEDKKVGNTISEKIRAFTTQTSSSSSPPRRNEVSPGKIEDRIQKFMEAAAGSSPSSQEHVSVGRIDDKLRAFEEVAKASASFYEAANEDVDLLTEDLASVIVGSADERRQRTDAVTGQPLSTPPKTEAGQAGAPIRSFNEGANATLRRTPSWLRQQRALEEANKAAGEAEVAAATPQAPVPVNADVEESKGSADEQGLLNEEETDTPSTPAKGAENETGTASTTSSIMKRAGSFKKDRTPSTEKRVVRFGHAEIHELPGSPKTPEVSGDVVKSASSGHSASKGSALAAYLKVMDSQARKRPFEPPTDAPSSPTSHEAPPSPPPPILSPGARSPSYGQALLAEEVAKEAVDLGDGVLGEEEMDGQSAEEPSEGLESSD